MSEETRKEIAKLVMERVLETAIKLPTSEQATMFTTMTVCAAIALMRDNLGDNFVRGFLMGALDDLDKPAERWIAPAKH